MREGLVWASVPFLIVALVALAPIAFVGLVIGAWRAEPVAWWHDNVKP